MLDLRKFRKQPKELLDQYTKLSVAFKDEVKSDQVNNKLTLEFKDEYVQGLDEKFVSYIKKEDKLVLDSTQYCMVNVMTYCKSEYVRE